MKICDNLILRSNVFEAFNGKNYRLLNMHFSLGANPGQPCLECKKEFMELSKNSLLTWETFLSGFKTKQVVQFETGDVEAYT